MDLNNQNSGTPETILDGSRFIRACLRKPVDERRFGFCGKPAATCRNTVTCASTTRW